MQVTVDETLTVIHKCQLLTFQKDETVRGDIAAYLLRTGAAVSPADDDAQRLADGVPAEEATPEAAVQPTESSSDGSELDITGTIDQVLAWVADDSERALAAHAAEEARGDKARTTLLSKLAEIGLD
jgi:hypothetical protein